MPIIDGVSCCLECKEKEIIRDFAFSGAYWFCSQECLDKYISNHPGTIFKSNTIYNQDKQYCPKCHKLMKKFFDINLGDYYKCKDCEE